MISGEIVIEPAKQERPFASRVCQRPPRCACVCMSYLAVLPKTESSQRRRSLILHFEIKGTKVTQRHPHFPSLRGCACRHLHVSSRHLSVSGRREVRKRKSQNVESTHLEAPPNCLLPFQMPANHASPRPPCPLSRKRALSARLVLVLGLSASPSSLPTAETWSTDLRSTKRNSKGGVQHSLSSHRASI